MKLHEYQAKQIFARYGVRIPRGKAVFKQEEIEPAAKALLSESGGEIAVVKAQIHAGGRGKGGGVKVCKGVAATVETGKKILGMQLVTKQTGPAGQKVRRLYLEEGLDIARELYLALLVDRVDIGTDGLNVRLRMDGLGGLTREMLAGYIGAAA